MTPAEIRRLFATIPLNPGAFTPERVTATQAIALCEIAAQLAELNEKAAAVLAGEYVGWYTEKKL